MGLFNNQIEILVGNLFHVLFDLERKVSSQFRLRQKVFSLTCRLRQWGPFLCLTLTDKRVFSLKLQLAGFYINTRGYFLCLDLKEEDLSLASKFSGFNFNTRGYFPCSTTVTKRIFSSAFDWKKEDLSLTSWLQYQKVFLWIHNRNGEDSSCFHLQH